MAKSETSVNNLKINRGTYANIQANLSSIGENELIITTDKTLPVPTTNDNGKVIQVNSSGEYELASILAPTAVTPVVSASNKFTFTGVSFDGLGVFSFGNCNTIINLYGLQAGYTYKQTGTFIYDSGGSVVTTTINVKRPSNTTDTLEISSGNSNYSIVNGFTGYLFKVKLG